MLCKRSLNLLRFYRSRCRCRRRGRGRGRGRGRRRRRRQILRTLVLGLTRQR